MTSVGVRGSVALVSGAGSGIGRATSLALARRGATVLCADIDPVSAKATAEACAATAGTGHAYELDVADRARVTEVAADVTREHGPLDILVNNAGVGVSGRFLDTPLEDWDWITGINLMGVVECCYAFGRPMVERGSGHVVNIASGLAYTHRSTESAYIATKAGVLALSRSLRADWRASGVGVSAICPGIINTPIVAHTRLRGAQSEPQAALKAQRLFAKGHPPERVAMAVLSAVARNRSVVPVGFEAWGAWLLHRLAPVEVADRLIDSTQRLTGGGN